MVSKSTYKRVTEYKINMVDAIMNGYKMYESN